MPAVPTTLRDNHGISYAVKFQPPTKLNPVARVVLFDHEDFQVAEMMFGERDPGYFYLDDIHVCRGTRRGIGSQLLSIAEAYAAEQGFSEVHGTIIAHQSDSANCAFLKKWYEARGYLVTYTEGHMRKEYCGDISKKIKPAEPLQPTAPSGRC